ncbi:MAG: helix-turn-helix domain-containing protein [Parabacteroides sp.]
MEKNKVRLLGIEDFKRADIKLDYADKEIVTISHWEQTQEMFSLQPPVKLDMFVVMVCMSGKLRIDINNHSLILEEGNLIACIPTSVIQKCMLLSPTCRFAMVCFSPSFMRKHLPWKKNTWEVISYLYNNPVHSIGKNVVTPFHSYFCLLMEIIKETSHPHQKEIIHHLFATVLLELAADLDQFLESISQGDDDDASFKQRDYIYARFMQELGTDDGTHRSVSYYAKRLCYTSKYISKVVKEVSGKTALELINQHVIDKIRYQLLHSTKSVKEIADDFEFSNISFFGKYVKSHLGASPTQFRKQASQKNEENQ